MTTREQAIQWFNEKDTYNKSELSHKYYKDSVSYNFTTLTGSEIEEIFRKENKTENIYLNRLKEQYKTTQKSVLNYNRNLQDYNAMRLFCLDTQLISFNGIELMENKVDIEVNQSF